MTGQIFDDIAQTFLSALAVGTVNLGVYALPLLAAFALISWYLEFGRALVFGGGQVGDALASALLKAVQIGILYWLLVNHQAMATAAYQTFLQWGMAVGGADVQGLLVTPGTVVDLGYKIAAPLQDTANRLTGFWGFLSMPDIFKLDLSVQIITWSFPFVALALLMTQVEYHLAVMLVSVLLPLAVFGPTAFLGEYIISWLVGGLIRVLLTAAIIGIGFPLLSMGVLTVTPGGDATNYSTGILALVSALYVYLAWVIPNKAANMCGRVSLGLTGSTVVGAMMGTARFAMVGTQAVKGVSKMIEGRAR